VTVGEERLVEARELGHATTGIAVDATGAAGLAGLLELRASGVHRPDESAVVLFTGAARD
jgi:threonine synthase